MAKATVFLVIFVELLSRLYCFAHAGTVAEGSILKTSHWIGTKQVTASNPSLFPNCRSQLECAVRCRRFSHCAAFTFDRESRTCSLFPLQKPPASSGQSQTVFWNTDPVCEYADIGNGTASWNSTLTSLEGDVTCNSDFMYTSVNTALRCHDNGTWEPPIGQCLQYYWRNTTGYFPLPRQVFPGWAVCAEGKPTANTFFRAGTKTNTSNALFWRFVISFNAVSDTLTVITDGNNIDAVRSTVQPFPFRAGQPFSVIFRLLSADHTYSLIINGHEYMQCKSTQPISDLTEVYFDRYVELKHINIWCV